jgi:hypothetical protein
MADAVADADAFVVESVFGVVGFGVGLRAGVETMRRGESGRGVTIAFAVASSVFLFAGADYLPIWECWHFSIFFNIHEIGFIVLESTCTRVTGVWINSVWVMFLKVELCNVHRPVLRRIGMSILMLK